MRSSYRRLGDIRLFWIDSGFIFQDKFAFDEERGAKGEQCEGLEPEVPLPAVKPIAEAHHNSEMLEYFYNANHGDASEDNASAAVIHGVSLLLATCSFLHVDRLRELADTEKCERQEEQRCPDVMQISDGVLSLRGNCWPLEFASRGEPGNTEGKDAGETTGYPVVEIVALGGQVEYADGA